MGINQLWLVMVLGLFLTGCQLQPDLNIDNDWQLYKTKFVAMDGRVIDTGNDNVSHSEGQGYGLLLALKMNDPEAFKRIWQWTKTNLQVRQDKLFIWRRRPATALMEEDKNNATDGDIIIAWVLLEAAKNWQKSAYSQEGLNILNDIKHKLVIQKNGLDVLLPGEQGFQFPTATQVNLSYWVYPALKVFASVDPDPIWDKLIASGQTLLQKARFGRWQLPPDWLDIKNDHNLSPAKTNRFGYDAVRIPLYLVMGNMSSDILTPFAKYWGFYRGYTPAWTLLNDNVMDSFGAGSGISAVKQVTLFATKHIESVHFATLDKNQDYYSATLLLLSKLSYRQIVE